MRVYALFLCMGVILSGVRTILLGIKYKEQDFSLYDCTSLQQWERLILAIIQSSFMEKAHGITVTVRPSVILVNDVKMM